MSNTRTLSGNTTPLEGRNSELRRLGTRSLCGYDPLGFDAGDANLYRFVGNDPVDEVDPTGLEAGVLRPGAPGAPILDDILGDTTVREQLIWFRRRQGANNHKKEEGGWVLYNKCTRDLKLTVDGVEQGTKHSTHRLRLPSIITSNYPTNTPKDPSGGPPPGFPRCGPPEPTGTCWVVVALWHTHPGDPQGLTDPADYNTMNAWGLPSIVQWGIQQQQVASETPR